jgi:hypothetical protein
MVLEGGGRSVGIVRLRTEGHGVMVLEVLSSKSKESGDIDEPCLDRTGHRSHNHGTFL